MDVLSFPVYVTKKTALGLSPKQTVTHMNYLFALVVSLLIISSTPISAGETDVVAATASKTGQGTYSFDVTLKHGDTGWKHYADKWDVIAEDGPQSGKVLGTRTLYHPHVEEQPFTRSLSDVRVPAGTTKVRIRGHDSQHAYGGTEKTIALPQ